MGSKSRGAQSDPRRDTIRPFERASSLEALEHDRWGPPAFLSHLVRTCHALRSRPVGGLSVEELRILIGQKLGLRILIPLALEKLKQAPLAAGDFFEGDLLLSVLRVPEDFWRANPREEAELRELAERASTAPLVPALRTAIAAFVQRSFSGR